MKLRMNIKEAKEEIKRTLKAYTGCGRQPARPIPPSKQRPILLIGPPGIGKTAIMEQIAKECGAGLVSYTMTHHTRQSAIGLPYLKSETFEGETFQVTEYTMSEIIASVYDCMRTTGCRYGILFIDEINCVSETLLPVMLQFLQNKTFGTHRVPDHWMIVAAGNPPEYNRSVREFDMVTLDRVRKIELEADYGVWKEYALTAGIHPAILSYLEIHPEYFYSSRLEAQHHAFVTARGWEDLSCILLSYEELEEPVSQQLMEQYLQHEEIARDFALYYRLFRTYGEEYDIAALLSSDEDAPFWKERCRRIACASADEGLALSSLLYDYLSTCLASFYEKQDFAEKISAHCDALCRTCRSGSFFDDGSAYLKKQRDIISIREKNTLYSPEEAAKEREVTALLEEWLLEIRTQKKNGSAASDDPVQQLLSRKEAQKKTAAGLAAAVSSRMERAYRLILERGSEDICVLHLTTDLSKNPQAAAFLFTHPCGAYAECCRHLLFSERELAIQKEIATSEASS